jgi:4-aminobutyrate aminotransferase-like enzyme
VVLASPGQGLDVCRRALAEGVIVLAEGAGDVLALTPPAVITSAQLDHALGVIGRLLESARTYG